MTLKLKLVYIASVIAIAFLAAALFLVDQRIAYADDNLADYILCDVIGGVGPAQFCSDEEGENPIPNPCDIFDAYGHPLPTCDEDPNEGGGSETPTCEEGKHLEGNECVPDEAAPPSNGGGSSSGSGGGGGGGGGGSVLGTTTPATTASCDQYIATFMRTGQQNDPEQVKRVQHILKAFEGADVEENGTYDAQSVAAVRTFQLKYADDILAPWGIKEPTGYVFLTTRKKLNEVYCQNTKAFPLTNEEAQHIELTKRAVAPRPVSTVTPAPVRQQAQPISASEEVVATTTQEEAAPVTNTGNRLSDFFRRLFNRFR